MIAEQRRASENLALEAVAFLIIIDGQMTEESKKRMETVIERMRVLASRWTSAYNVDEANRIANRTATLTEPKEPKA